MLFFFTIVFLEIHGKLSFEGYKVYSVLPYTAEHVALLTDLPIKINANFWSEQVILNNDVKIMIDPTVENHFIDILNKNNLTVEIEIQNVQRLIDRQMQPILQKRNARNSLLSFDWLSYHNLDDIYQWLDDLQENYPAVVKTHTIGTTIENRPIRGVIIDFKRNERTSDSLHFMIEAGIHAREWISPATATYIIKELLTSDDETIREMADLFVWHIIPVTNPDGYAFTFDENRMWRKNRNNESYTTCVSDNDNSVGIDLNRNFDFEWGTVGVSVSPCGSTYPGTKAFSEAESIAVSNYVLSVQNSGNLMYYISFHSYSQLLLLPPAYTDEASKTLTVNNYGDLYEIGIRGMDKLKKSHGTDYITGPPGLILYPASGGSIDWVKLVANVPIVLLYELREKGENGFLLPPEEIIPNCEEVMDSLKEIHVVTMDMGYYYKSSSATMISYTIVTIFTILISILFR